MVIAAEFLPTVFRPRVKTRFRFRSSPAFWLIHLGLPSCVSYPAFSVTQWSTCAADKTLLYLQHLGALRTPTGFPDSLRLPAWGSLCAERDETYSFLVKYCTTMPFCFPANISFPEIIAISVTLTQKVPGEVSSAGNCSAPLIGDYKECLLLYAFEHCCCNANEHEHRKDSWCSRVRVFLSCVLTADNYCSGFIPHRNRL